MKLNDMIFVIENRKGTVEANFLLTLDDTIEMLNAVRRVFHERDSSYLFRAWKNHD